MRLKELRELQNLSLEQLSRDLHVNKSTLSRIENGLREPKQSFIEDCAKYFNVSIDYFLQPTNNEQILPYFGNILKNLRLSKGIKQSDLAKIINVSTSTIGMYEQGRREPDFNILKKISIYFNVSIDSLIGISDCNKNCNIGYRISELLEKQGITQRDLAKMINVTETTISRYINNSREPKGSILNDIAVALNVSSDYLLGRENDTLSDLGVPVFNKISNKIPIGDFSNIVGYEKISKEIIGNDVCFAFKVNDNSMEPIIIKDDIVIVRKQSNIESGNLFLILTDSNTTIRKILKQDNGFLLISNNNTLYPPKFYNISDMKACPFTIIGKIIELRRKF